MEDKTPKDIQKTDCCAGGECCSSSSTNEREQRTGKKQWWEIAAFVVGIVLIIAAISYSLIIRNSAASNNTVTPIAGSSQCSAPTMMGIGDLNWVKNLDTLFAKNDFIFVTLIEGNDDSDTALVGIVASVAATIRAKGVSVHTMTIDKSNPEFSATTDRLGVSQFPTVLVLGKNGNGAIVTSNLDKNKLLQSYTTVSEPSTCAPGCCQ